MLNHQKIETMSPSGITVGYKVFLNVRMKPNDKETEYMKMKIINSYQKSFLSHRIILKSFINSIELQQLKKLKVKKEHSRIPAETMGKRKHFKGSTRRLAG